MRSKSCRSHEYEVLEVGGTYRMCWRLEAYMACRGMLALNLLLCWGSLTCAPQLRHMREMPLLCVKWHSYVSNDTHVLDDSLMCSAAQACVVDHWHSPMMIDTHQSMTLTNQWCSPIHYTHQFSVSIASYWCVYALANVFVSSCYSHGTYATQFFFFQYQSLVSDRYHVRIRAYGCIYVYTNIPVFHRSSVPLWNQNWSKRLYPSQ